MGRFKAALDTHTFKKPRGRRPGRAPRSWACRAPRTSSSTAAPCAAPCPTSSSRPPWMKRSPAARNSWTREPRSASSTPLSMNGKGQGTRCGSAAATAARFQGEVYKVEVDKAPRKGGQAPKITLIEFSDFQCPFCSARQGHARPAARSSTRTTCRSPFKQLPLPFHNNAMPAAIAAVAADRAGQVLGDARQAVRQPAEPGRRRASRSTPRDRAEHRQVQGRHRQTPRPRQLVEADMKQASNFGVQRHAQLLRQRPRLQRRLSAGKLQDGSSTRKSRRRMPSCRPARRAPSSMPPSSRTASTRPKRPRRQGATQASRQPTEIYKAEVKGAPIKGAKDALVTIVQFSDFQCPFCSRVEPTIDQIMKDYNGKVRVAWRNMPLPFHDNAKPAAIAAWPPTQQGKFWQMHDILFKNQQHLDAATTSRNTRRRSASTWPSSRPPSRTRSCKSRRRSRRGDGRQARRARHAGVLHQRQLPRRARSRSRSSRRASTSS